MDKIRAIQVGLGNFGRSWLKALTAHADIEIVAVVDSSQDKLDAAAEVVKQIGAAAYLNHEDAFANVEADLAVVVTPPFTHKTVALDALAAGLHVLMEKPLADTFESALELYEEAGKYSTQLMISQNYRWKPEIQAVKRCLDSGAIGQVEYIQWEYNMNHRLIDLGAGNWRNAYEEVLLLEMSIHHFDLLRYFFDAEAVSVYASSMNPSWSAVIGNTVASATFNFEGGRLASYFGSWAGRGRKTRWNGDFRLVGSKGAIELYGNVPYLFNEETGSQVEIEYERPEHFEGFYLLRYAIDEVVKALRENRRFPTDVSDNIKTFALTEGAIRSARTGKVVELENGLLKL